MLFHTPAFFAFFAGYLLLHRLLPDATRAWLIVAGGLVFYSHWQPSHAWLPLGLTLIALLGARAVAAQADTKARRNWLAFAIVFLLLPLGVFKYTRFILADVLGPLLPALPLPAPAELPLGVSFITFTLIAYVVDVARRDFPAGTGPLLLTANVVFFPHLGRRANSAAAPAHPAIGAAEKPARNAVDPGGGHLHDGSGQEGLAGRPVGAGG